MPKLIAIDLDGTLLDSDYAVSEENIECLKKVHSMGIKIVPATGRRFFSAIKYIELFPHDSFLILQNGALILDSVSREIFFQSTIDRDVKNEILKFNSRKKLYPIYVPSQLLGNKIYIKSDLRGYRVVEKYLLTQRGRINLIDDDCDLINVDISQIGYHGTVSEMNGISEELKKLFSGEVNVKLTVYPERDLSILDVMRRGVSKGSALEMIMKYYGFRRNEVWSIGDNMNDIEMFKVSGFSMAVENSCNLVKENASSIIPANNESGVSQGLTKFLFGGGKMSKVIVPCLNCNTKNRIKDFTRVAVCGRCKSPLPDPKGLNELDGNNFYTVIKETTIPVLVDFWAPWCGPCRMVHPVLENLSKEFVGDVLFCKLNVDENQSVAKNYGIFSIPTMILFKNGEVLDKITGAYPESEIKNWLLSNI